MKVASARGGTMRTIASAGRLPCCFIFDHSADDEPYDQQDDRENDDGSQMIFCILHNVCFTHNFIVLFSLFIESVVIFIEYRCAKVGLISQSAKTKSIKLYRISIFLTQLLKEVMGS